MSSDGTPTRAYAVWKFPLRWGEVTVDMPKWARILHVGNDPASDYPAVWALVNTLAETEARKLVVVGTGHAVRSESLYLGTFIDGPSVWHVFETTESKILASFLGAFT